MRRYILFFMVLALVVAATVNCSNAFAFRDSALSGYDNPMDTRDEYDKKSEEPRIITAKDVSASSENSLIQDDLPEDDGGKGELP